MSVYRFGTKADVIPFPGGTGVRPIRQHELDDTERYVEALDAIVTGMEVAQRCECADLELLGQMQDALRKIIRSAFDAEDVKA